MREYCSVLIPAGLRQTADQGRKRDTVELHLSLLLCALGVRQKAAACFDALIFGLMCSCGDCFLFPFFFLFCLPGRSFRLRKDDQTSHWLEVLTLSFSQRVYFSCLLASIFVFSAFWFWCCCTSCQLFNWHKCAFFTSRTNTVHFKLLVFLYIFAISQTYFSHQFLQEIHIF